MEDCIFCKIIDKSIPSEIVYEDEKVLAFKDISPQAPVHILVIPKEHYTTLNDIQDYGIYPYVFKAVDEITRKYGIKESGYRVVVNCNEEGGQVVRHVHFHILGGRQLTGQLG